MRVLRSAVCTVLCLIFSFLQVQAQNSDPGWFGAGLSDMNDESFKTLGWSEKCPVVAEIDPRGPAKAAELKAGDIICSISGKSVHTSDELIAQILAHAPGDQVALLIFRTGGYRALKVTLGTRPSNF